MLRSTSWPIDLVFTRSMKSRATLKFTSASSSAKRTSRKDSLTFSSEIFPKPRRFLKALWSLVLNESNIRLNYASQSVFTRPGQKGRGRQICEADNLIQCVQFLRLSHYSVLLRLDRKCPTPLPTISRNEDHEVDVWTVAG